MYKKIILPNGVNKIRKPTRYLEMHHEKILAVVLDIKLDAQIEMSIVSTHTHIHLCNSEHNAQLIQFSQRTETLSIPKHAYF